MSRTGAILAAFCLVGCGPPGHANAPMDRSADAKLDCKDDPSRSFRDELPRREHCLSPPWIVASEAATVEGLKHTVCEGEERAHVFSHEGGKTLSSQDELAFLERHRAQLHALPGVKSTGWGICCRKGSVHPCTNVEVDLCTTQMEGIARAFAGFVEKDALGDVQLNLVVRLSGLTGPRCDGKKGSCGPEPYVSVSLAKAGYRCDGERRRVMTQLAWGTCAHDGECQSAGCGNQCVPWTQGALIGTCEGYPAMEEAPAFCGCVQGGCAWFLQ